MLTSFAAGDTLLLELASSPGRIIGDARGRWGVGAVPEGGGAAVELAASLHVFGATAAEEEAVEMTPLLGLAAAPAAPVALLVESAAGSPGVMQLLSAAGADGGGGEGNSTPYHADNAIVLSSRQPGSEPRCWRYWAVVTACRSDFTHLAVPSGGRTFLGSLLASERPVVVHTDAFSSSLHNGQKKTLHQWREHFSARASSCPRKKSPRLFAPFERSPPSPPHHSPLPPKGDTRTSTG